MSRDGKIIVSGGEDRRICVWEATTQANHPEQLFALEGHESVVEQVTITADGTRLASADARGKLIVWDTKTGEQITKIGQFTFPVFNRFSPALTNDGQKLAVSHPDGRIEILSLTDRNHIPAFAAHEGRVNCLAFTSDGRHLVSGGQDGAVSIWNAKTGELEHQCAKHEAAVNQVIVSPNDETVASCATTRTIWLWDLATQERRPSKVPAKVRSVAFSPDGSYVACGCVGASLHICLVATAKKVNSSGGSSPSSTKVPSTRVAWLPDRRVLVTARQLIGNQCPILILPRGKPRLEPLGPIEAPKLPRGQSFALSFSGEARDEQLAGKVRPNITSEFVWLRDLKKFAATGPFTIEAWVLPRMPKQFPATVVGNIDAGDNPYGVGIGITNKPDGEEPYWVVSFHNGKELLSIFSEDQVTPEKAVHVACVFDEQSIRMFIDGKLQRDRKDTLFPLKASPLRFMIGANPHPIGRFLERPRPIGLWPFHGLVDQVRFSKVSRYAGDFTPKQQLTALPETVALYRFHRGVGMTARDASSNQFTGRIFGASWETTSAFNAGNLKGNRAVDLPPKK